MRNLFVFWCIFLRFFFVVLVFCFRGLFFSCSLVVWYMAPCAPWLQMF
jgi:hypothetical protein